MIAKLKETTSDYTDKIAGIADLIKKNEGLAAFYLFGSYAKGKNTPLSDLDLAYLPLKALNEQEVQALDKEVYLKISRYLSTDDITLINLRKTPITLAVEAIQGKLLYLKSKNELISFKEHLMILYPEIRAFKQELLQSFSHKLGEKYGN